MVFQKFSDLFGDFFLILFSDFLSLYHRYPKCLMVYFLGLFSSCGNAVSNSGTTYIRCLYGLHYFR
jgi:hypothetical protein